MEVLDGDAPLIKSQYILNCLMNEKQIELDLIKKSDIEIDAGSKEDELMDEKMVALSSFVSYFK